MSKSLVNPVLFSKHFNVDPAALRKARLLDPLLNSDTKLFIDPLLLPSSANRTIKKEGFAHLKERFENIVRLLDACEKEGDAAWKGAEKLLSLAEMPETGLGYGGAGTSGSSRSRQTRQTVLKTAREIIALGVKDPQIISLMGLFDEGVGPDTISDMATAAIMPALAKITEEFCAKHGVPTQPFPAYEGRNLPANPFKNTPMPIILVPDDIVRDLPLAADWSDVDRVVSEIDEIREAVNRQIADFTRATLTDKKHALKKAALASRKRFEGLFKALLASSEPYDPNGDVLGFYALRDVMARDAAAFKTNIKPPAQPSRDELKRVVDAIVAHFKFMIENNNLWELLWDDRKPKREKAAQLLFFAVADMFCKANNIDISPETHSGGGPVDFKFSVGYVNRLVVEVKLSKGTVVHGYKTQLEIYKTASQTDAGVFLVIDVGGMGRKLIEIKKHRELMEAKGHRVSDIVVVDGKRKASASVAKIAPAAKPAAKKVARKRPRKARGA